MTIDLLGKYRYSLILLRELVITEFKLRYQGSVLGYLWSLLKPLFLFAILYYVFVHFLKIGEGIPNWPIAMLMGIVLWNFFAEITGNGLNAIVARGDVIRKINFPKYVIILASSISALINLALNFVIIVIFLFFAGIDFHWSALLAPIYVLEIFALGIGLAFILSTVFVRLRDVNYIWEIFMQALFYGSAVIYPIAVVTEKAGEGIATLLMFNPITQAIQDARHVFIDPVNPTLYTTTGSFLLSLIPIAFVVAVLVFGAWLFRRRSPYFAEEV